jgi:hypothetical protein
MSMRRPLRTGLAAATVLALAGGPLAACGGSGDPIPASRAADLKAQLDAVKAAVAARNCDGAEQAVAQVKGDVLNLPSSVDEDLRGRLQEGVDNLAERVPAACGSAGSSTEERTPSTTQDKRQTETQKTDTQGTDTEQKETTPTETQPTQTTPTQTQTQPTTPTETTPAPDTGGASPNSQGTP